jgi:hypothetical protein
LIAAEAFWEATMTRLKKMAIVSSAILIAILAVTAMVL